MILGDDDMLEPDFLTESVKIFDKYPELGFTFAQCNKVDINEKVLMPWGYHHFKEGYIKGTDYLLETARQGCCLTNSTTTLLRKEVFKRVGLFGPEVTKNTFDFNMWLRIAAKFDVYFIDKFMSRYTLHPDQISELHWRGKVPTGRIGTRMEILTMLSNLVSKKNNEITVSKLFRLNLTELSKLLEKIMPEL